MEDDLGPPSPSDLRERGVADVHLVELRARGDVLALARERSSTTTTSSPRAEQRIDEIRADEAGSACDDGNALF